MWGGTGDGEVVSNFRHRRSLAYNILNPIFFISFSKWRVGSVKGFGLVNLALVGKLPLDLGPDFHLQLDLSLLQLGLTFSL